MDLNKFPPIPQSEQEKLADQQLVSLRIEFGDRRAEYLAKVGLAIAQYVVTRTENPKEGLAVMNSVVDALKLAIKLDNLPGNDPSSN